MAYMFCFKKGTMSNMAVIVSCRNIIAYDSSAWLPSILEIEEGEEEARKAGERLSGSALSFSSPFHSLERSPAKQRRSETEMKNLQFLVHKPTQVYNLCLRHDSVLKYPT